MGQYGENQQERKTVKVFKNNESSLFMWKYDFFLNNKAMV